jgi:hypothetical protein
MHQWCPLQRLLLRPDSTHENARGSVPPASTNIRMTILKNLESSGTLVHYIVPMTVVGLTFAFQPRRPALRLLPRRLAAVGCKRLLADLLGARSPGPFVATTRASGFSRRRVSGEGSSGSSSTKWKLQPRRLASANASRSCTSSPRTVAENRRLARSRITSIGDALVWLEPLRNEVALVEVNVSQFRQRRHRIGRLPG